MTSMRRAVFCLAAAGLCCVLTATGCGPIERTDCTDGVDNDGDGFIDGDDPGCALNDGLEAPDPAQCSDGVDNDDDGLIDDQDFGCGGADDDDETDPIRGCNDGIDNDADGLADFPEDPGCDSPVDDDEFNPAECQDGVDNDGDSRIDYPNDPGCDLPEDDDETTPDPLPACSNNADDDGDELTDYPTDPGCNSAADNDEFNLIPGACGPLVEVVDISGSGEFSGSLTGPRPNELTSLECNGFGGEFAFTYSVTEGGKALVVSTDHPETTLDTIVYVRTECRNPDTELGCDDDGGELRSGNSHLVIPSAEAGTYYIVVDAFGPGSLGDFKVSVVESAGLGATCDPTDPTACVDGLVCREVTPGVGFTCEVHVCEDGVDNDGDTIADFPDDPGCLSPTDDDETTPDPAPECGNGTDDDGDTLIDYPDDPGCAFAADGAEIDECIPGVEVEAHAGGAVTGATAGSSAFTAPAGCGFNTNLAPEDVYAFNNVRDLTDIAFSTEGSTFDTVLYVRTGDCAIAGPATQCNDNTVGTTSEVTLTDPPSGHLFAFVDGKTSTPGSYTLTITGHVRGGTSCDASDANFPCEPGFTCDAGTCVETECNDGVDNGDPEDTLADADDPGCASILDDDETDPSPLPECGNGIDDDGDTLVDYPDDPGCLRAGDDAEIDECVPGVEIEVHPGGTVSGTTVGGTTVLEAPAGCGFSTLTAPERVFLHNNTRDLSELVFSTEGSALDTVLYVRVGDCGVAGPAGQCNDNTIGTSSRVVFEDPAVDGYFAIVDGKSTIGNTFDLSITGTINPGGACDAGNPSFVCSFGYACSGGGTCEPAECNDGVDNADPEDTLADADDPGCVSIDDDDEEDPDTPPACANGIDDDGDLLADYPADPGCTRAGDDSEEDCVILDDFEMGWPTGTWVSVDGGGSTSAAAAHDGSFGLTDPGWHYQSGPVLFNTPGDILSFWGNMPSGGGRIYLGFGGSAAGCKSFVLAPNTTDIRFQDNPSFGFTELTVQPFTFTAGRWYFIEIEYLGGTMIEGRVYDEDGVTLLGSATETFASSVSGGVALRAFGANHIDTIEYCGDIGP